MKKYSQLLGNYISNFVSPGDLKKFLSALFLFIVLSVLLTYPLVVTSFSRLPGSMDIVQAVWYFWMTGQAIHEAIATGTLNELVFTDQIFYPSGTNMIPFGMAYSQVLALILTPALGSVFTCNLLYFSAFVLSGFGAYTLVRHITRDETAGIVAGIIYTFAPYHFEHAFVGHMGSVTMQWIPFCALFLLKMAEDKKVTDAILAAVFFIMVALSDLQYMVFMGLFIGLFFVYRFITGELKFVKKDLTQVLIFTILSLLVILPLNISNIAIATAGDNFLSPARSEAELFSVDLANFLIPSITHPIVGDFVSSNIYHNDYRTQFPWESVAFIGFSVLFLSIYASLKECSKKILFWQISAAFFALMSLGPILHVLGQSVFFGQEIPLPFGVLSQIVPGLSNSRTPGRFEVITLLSISVLAGIGIQKVMNDIAAHSQVRSKVKMLRVLIPIGIAALIILEYLAVPFVTTDPSVPTFYQELATEPGDFAVIEIPASYSNAAGTIAEYYQTVHQKKMVGGQMSRVPDSSRMFERQAPFISQISYPESNKDLFGQNVSKIASSVLNSYNIRYVVLHNDFMEQNWFCEVDNLTTVAMGPSVYSDGRIVAYKVDSTANQPFVEQGQGWNGIENWDGIPASWMINNATIAIHSSGLSKVIINATCYSFNTQRDLLVYENGTLINTFVIPPCGKDISIPVETGNRDVVLLLYTPQKPERPVDIHALNSTDSHYLSMAISNVSVSFT